MYFIYIYKIHLAMMIKQLTDFILWAGSINSVKLNFKCRFSFTPSKPTLSLISNFSSLIHQRRRGTHANAPCLCNCCPDICRLSVLSSHSSFILSVSFPIKIYLCTHTLSAPCAHMCYAQAKKRTYFVFKRNVPFVQPNH